MKYGSSAGQSSGARELKTRTHQKKAGRRFLACLTAALVMVSMTAAGAVPVFAAGKTTKEETVYVITDAAGTQEEMIVSDHLSNKNSTDTISDVTTLKNIENVKGDEKYKKGSGNKITWQADGNDIYYQGTTDKDAPVDVNIKYYLDGEKTTGEKLQGKSGDVKIEIEYENNQSSNGVKVPFVAMTGFLAEDDCMTNITVSTGKVIDDGEKTIVVGMAVPGLAESLDISSDTLGISDKITIKGKAKDFSLEDMMTVMTSDLFEDVDTSTFSSLDLDSQVKALDSGAKKLVSGSNTLYEGIHMLYGKTGTLKSGVDSLDSGASSLKDGTASALSGSQSLASGSAKFANILDEKLGTMRDGASKLYTGSKSISSGINQVAAGINGTSSQTGLADGAASVSTGIQQIAAGVNGDGTSSNPGLVNGAASVSSGVDELAESLSSAGTNITTSVTALKEAEESLTTLKDELKDELTDAQKKTIDDAITKIKSSETIQSGIAGGLSTEKMNQLKAGAKSVSDGLKSVQTGLNGSSTSAGLVKGSASVASGLKTVQAGLNGDGTSSNPGLVSGAASLESGAKSLADGLGLATAEGTDDNPSLTSSAKTIASGAKTLAEGEKQLNSGAEQLAAGMTQLNESSGKLISGIKKLDTGSLQLQKGMKQLYDEGISKIVDLYNSKVKGVAGNAESVINAGKEYKTFTELADGMDGSVKFIYKTKVSGE